MEKRSKNIHHFKLPLMPALITKNVQWSLISHAIMTNGQRAEGMSTAQVLDPALGLRV